MPLAIASYADLPALGDAPGLLNLAWTLDERACLSADLPALVASELESEARDGLPYVQRYLVDDPHGEAIVQPALAAFFERPDWRPAVVSGAGVISLLHALARFAGGGAVHFASDCYPDFPLWVERAGGELAPTAEAAGLVFLERPSLIGDGFASLSQVGDLCAAAAARGAAVLIDESNANYHPPSYSAVNLLPGVDNLIVLRGMSKGYGLGGLRLGLCVASDALGERVRAAVPPLLASSLSLRTGTRVLALGDVGAPLRSQIRNRKQELLRLLDDTAAPSAQWPSEGLPYVLFDDPQAGAAYFEPRGILGKPHTVWSRSEGHPRQVYRLSVPLTDPRMELLRAKLRAAPSDRRSAPPLPAPPRSG